MTCIRRRDEALDAAVPRKIVLSLNNGSLFAHDGPPLQFFEQALTKIRAGRGPPGSAGLTTVAAEGGAGGSGSEQDCEGGG